MLLLSGELTTPYSPTTLVRFPVISHRKRSVWCFLFVTLFNLQGTRLIGGAIYCTTELWVCQVLFSKFFRRRSQLSWAATFLVYHTQKRLSRTFFRSFLTSDPSRISSNLFRLPHLSLAVKNFFHFFPARLITAPTALLEYQIIPHLSTPFSNFLCFFYFPLYFQGRCSVILTF